MSTHSGRRLAKSTLDAPAVACRRRAGRIDDPLGLWRTTHPARISRTDVDRIARRLATTEILHERRWRVARAGDAAAAAAIAIDHLRGRHERTVLSDIILGNLVVLAGRGDATAPVIIAHALRAFGRIEPADTDMIRLAACWTRRSVPTHRTRARRFGR
jgi:hypothetical protein